jgi:replication fork clamp-binding protein CrfC
MTMTGEEMERAIEFLLENQAKNTSDMAILKESVDKLVQAMAEERRERRREIAAYRRETREQLEAYRFETREAINNLIIANEVTRDLANQAARLAIATSQRVTALENKAK